MNTIHLIGELVNPVVLKRDRITKSRLGQGRHRRAAREPGAIDFVPVALSNREAEMAARYLGDGSLVSVESHLHSALQADQVTDSAAD